MRRAEIDRYIQAVQRAVQCPPRRKAHFLEQLRDSVSRYVAEHPGVTRAELEKEYGTPGQIAHSFLEEANLLSVGRAVRRARRALGGLLAVALAAVVVGACEKR